ncbi:MAG: Hpt domain-containing protein [Deltaproteobacteria bacterium]|nr:Hpt domain-containing protein [Deltaproteobacteria bacterium]
MKQHKDEDMDMKAPMNFKQAVEEFEGDEEFVFEMVDGFLTEVKAQIKSMRQAIIDGDADVVWREAHSIKGGAANLTAIVLSETAFRLERIGKSGNLEGSVEVLQKLEEEVLRLKEYARNQRAG